MKPSVTKAALKKAAFCCQCIQIIQIGRGRRKTFWSGRVRTISPRRERRTPTSQNRTGRCHEPARKDHYVQALPVGRAFLLFQSAHLLSLTCIHASDSLRRALAFGPGASGKILPPILPGNFVTPGTRKQQNVTLRPRRVIHEKNHTLFVGRYASMRGDSGCSCAGNNAAAESTGDRSGVYQAG